MILGIVVTALGKCLAALVALVVLGIEVNAIRKLSSTDVTVAVEIFVGTFGCCFTAVITDVRVAGVCVFTAHSSTTDVTLVILGSCVCTLGKSHLTQIALVVTVSVNTS